MTVKTDSKYLYVINMYFKQMLFFLTVKSTKNAEKNVSQYTQKY